MERTLGSSGALIAVSMTAMLFVNVLPAQESVGTPVKAEEFRLANKSIARTMAWPGGRLATRSIENLLARQTCEMETGDEFQIQIDGIAKPVTAASAKVIGAETRNIEGGTRLVVRLIDPALEGATLRVIYELKDADFFGRKWIEIDPPEGKKIPVAALTVESLKFPAKATCSYQPSEKGQPVYLDDLFLGLEWPGAANAYQAPRYTATHWPAWDVEKGFASKHAVWGAAPAGEVSHWFIEKYVAAIRMTPATALFVRHEPYMSGDMDYKVHVVQTMVAGYRDNLFKKYGVQLDSYGIRKSGPYITEPQAPDGFKTAQQILQTDMPDCHIGLNWSFCGTAYEPPNPDSIKKFGLETNAGAFCMLGSNYVKWAQEKIRHNIIDLGVNDFADDNYLVRPCTVAGHGHRIEGGAADESRWEGMMRFARFSKDLNPKLFLQRGFGFDLPSPWLLAGGYDCVPMPGGSGAEVAASAGVGSRRERWINVGDGGMYDTCNKVRSQIPPNSFLSAEIIKANKTSLGNQSLGSQNQPAEEWEHDLMMSVGRGGMPLCLAIHADETTDSDWAFLAKTIIWARTNAVVLANNTRLLPGKVLSGEPYGYSHSKDNRCIVFLRNPSLPGALDLKDGWKVQSVAQEEDIPKDFAASAFDDGAWQKVDDLRKFQPSTTGGYLLYRCRVTVPAEWKGKRISLFGMTATFDTDKDVFLNGKALPAEIGGQNGGDVSGALAYGAENVLAVRMKPNMRYAAFAKKLRGPITLANLDAESTVQYTLDPKVSGFDPKYTRATVKWVYPEGRTEPKTLEVGKPVKFAMKPFDVLVFELKLE